jgi:hypothetical protein
MDYPHKSPTLQNWERKKKKKPRVVLIISYYSTIIYQVSNILNPSIIEIKIISIERRGGQQ